MMREIKFRVRRQDGAWCYGSPWMIWGDSHPPNSTPVLCYIIDLKGDKSLVDTETVEQFTGLRDKNGHEIYEGDIVSTEARNHGKGIEVRFHNSSWHGFYRELRFILTEGELLEEYIVIGNIHENPDLLKGANT